MTTFVDYLLFVNKYEIKNVKPGQIKELKKKIIKGVDWLIDRVHKGKIKVNDKEDKDKVIIEEGYFWTINDADNTPSVYSTYTGLIAIATILDNKDLFKEFDIDTDRIKEIMNGVLKRLMSVLNLK